MVGVHFTTVPSPSNACATRKETLRRGTDMHAFHTQSKVKRFGSNAVCSTTPLPPSPPYPNRDQHEGEPFDVTGFTFCFAERHWSGFLRCIVFCAAERRLLRKWEASELEVNDFVKCNLSTTLPNAGQGRSVGFRNGEDWILGHNVHLVLAL